MIISPLSIPDRKSLRVTCQRLEIHTSTSIFRRIVISFLKKDRDNFFCISSTPRLRDLIQEIVWYECRVHVPSGGPFLHDVRAWFPHFESFAQYRDTYYPLALEEVDGFVELATRLVDGYRESLWWIYERDSVPPTSQPPIQDFLKNFTTALRALSNLRTIVSRRMLPDHFLPLSDWPFTANFMLQDPPDGPSDCGLVLLFSAISATDLKIENLYWEDHYDGSSLPHFSLASFPSCLRNLCVIDICLSPHLYSVHADVRTLQSALQTCLRLRHLKLCLERGLCFERGLPRRLVFDVDGMKAFEDLLDQSCWESLERLELVDFAFREEQMLAFLRKHTESLHHLGLQECAIHEEELSVPGLKDIPIGNWNALIRGMAAIKDLRLFSLQITQREDAILVPEEKLLRYINDNKDNPLQQSKDYFLIRTSETIFDHEAWPDIVFHDSPNYPGWYVDVEQDSDDSSTVSWNPPSPKTHWHLRKVRGTIVYWSTPDPEPRTYETQQWRFKRPNGDCAYGDDPLDYFSDWDSDDGGDVAEPTPYGEYFDEFERGDTKMMQPGDPSNEVWPEHAVAHTAGGPDRSAREFQEALG